MVGYLAAGQAETIGRVYNLWALRHDIRLPIGQLPPGLRDFCLSRGFLTDEIYSPLLEPKDIYYLQRMLLLKRIARAVCGSAASPLEIASRLFAFVTNEIAPRALADSHERPEDILVRGYGSCDQACWALVALAEQMGLAGMIIFLRDPESGLSPHTIAALHIEDRWLLFDPFAAIRFVDNRGRDLNLGAALRNPRLWRQHLTGNLGLFEPDHLPWACFLVYTEARGCLPRWSVFEQALGISSPRLWFNPLKRVADFRRYVAMALSGEGENPDPALRASAQKSLPHFNPPAGLDCRIYGEPFQMECRYADRGWLAEQKKSRSQGIFRSGRLLHLTGRWDEALRIFETAEPQTASEAEDILRYRALTLEAIGRYEDAIACYETLEKNEGFWASASAWNIYQCLQAMGRSLEAEQVSRRVGEPRRSSILAGSY